MSTAQAKLDSAFDRLDAIVNRRVREEEAALKRDDAARADADAAQARADDLRCRELAAEFQSDYAAFSCEPPMVRGDEWASDYHCRLLRGLQRRLSPRNDYAHPALLDGLSGRAFDNLAGIIRAEAAREAASPSFENLPPSGELISRNRVDSATGERSVEWFGKRSFIADMGRPGRKVLRLCNPKTGDVLLGRPFAR
jgi:hypothetical protein